MASNPSSGANKKSTGKLSEFVPSKQCEIFDDEHHHPRSIFQTPKRRKNSDFSKLAVDVK